MTLDRTKRHPARAAHRADLDGLRGLAVLAVLFFHIGWSYAPGGFVGVDVFFVLSGYLITQQIASELAEGRFSLASFYDRRIRRLLPALFAMLLGTTILALFVLLPNDLDHFGESLISAAFSVSNAYFWSQSDYFAPRAESMPLLHTWSLAVEAQFYILFAPLLMLTWRFAQSKVRLVIGLLAALSFILSLWSTRNAPEAAFYLLPARAWELLVGALLALSPQRAWPNWWRSLGLLTGLGGILLAVVTYQAGMAFPGFAAALPVMGCALIIWSGHAQPALSHAPPPHAWAWHLISWRPLGFIGLFSYSLYLWHWPLIVFARQTAEPLSSTQLLLTLGLIFGLGLLSWRFIEQPLRYGGPRQLTARLRLRYSSAIVGVLALLGMMIDVGNGFPWLQPKAVLAVVDDAQDRSPIRKRCHMGLDEQGVFTFGDSCTFGPESGRRVVVFGDSHGAEISYALSQIASQSGLHVRQITASACPPALGFSRDGRPNCPRHNLKMLQGLIDSPPATVLLMGHYFSWARLSGATGDLWRGLDTMVERLRSVGHDVILIGPWPPHPQGSLPHALAREIRHGRPAAAYTFPIEQAMADLINGRLQQIALRHGGRYLSLLEAVCGARAHCRGMSEGQSIYFDEDHLSVAHARRVVRAHLLPALGVPVPNPEPARSSGPVLR